MKTQGTHWPQCILCGGVTQVPAGRGGGLPQSRPGGPVPTGVLPRKKHGTTDWSTYPRNDLVPVTGVPPEGTSGWGCPPWKEWDQMLTMDLGPHTGVPHPQCGHTPVKSLPYPILQMQLVITCRNPTRNVHKNMWNAGVMQSAFEKHMCIFVCMCVCVFGFFLFIRKCFSALFCQKCVFFCWASYFDRKIPLFWRFWTQRDVLSFKVY